MKKFVNLWTILLAGALVVLLFSGGMFYNFVNSTRNTGIQSENNLVGQYNSNKTELADAAIQITETMGVADKASDQVQGILTAALSGRYGDRMDGEGATNGSLINALSVVESENDVSGVVENYSKVQDTIVATRTSFKNKQNQLQIRVADYKTWLKSGIVRSQVVKMQGFPSDDLSIETADGTVLYGRAALDKMEKPIIDQSTADAFETGVLKPIITPEADAE